MLLHNFFHKAYYVLTNPRTAAIYDQYYLQKCLPFIVFWSWILGNREIRGYEHRKHCNIWRLTVRLSLPKSSEYWFRICLQYLFRISDVKSRRDNVPLRDFDIQIWLWCLAPPVRQRRTSRASFTVFRTSSPSWSSLLSVIWGDLICDIVSNFGRKVPQG